jgi:shikimate kinase/3-dehydroquinate synthase
VKIVLTGFMLAGKTTIGNLLSEELGIKFYDSDQLISEQEGLTIKEIFKLKGEAYFRKLEKEVITKLLYSDGSFVLSPGGGAVLNEQLRELFNYKAESFCLDIDAKTVLERYKNSKVIRPLLEVKSPLLKVKELLEERADYYQQVNYHIDSTCYSPEEIVEIVINKLAEERLSIEIQNKNFSYPVSINKNFNEFTFADILTKVRGRKVFLLADKLVLDLHGHDLINLLEEEAEVITYALTAGEEIKDLNYLAQCFAKLYEHNFSRSDYLIAFGGGTIGDLGGFVASTFLRGIKLIQLPTTLISQLDSSVGGKTGVNYQDTKNLIGSFYQPEIVYYQLEWLKTLAMTEIKSGLGEIIKYAILDGESLFSILENNKQQVLNLNEDIMLKIARMSLQLKDYHVRSDVRDRGLRKKLNLGHSFGHAVEAAEKFKFKHGEAVVMGIAFTAFLSNKIGSLSKKSFTRIINLIQNYGYEIFPSEEIDAAQLASYLVHDKKISDNKLWWVLINDIGSTYLSDRFNQQNIQQYMEEYLCREWQ